MTTYKDSGVDIEKAEKSKRDIISVLKESFKHRKGFGSPMLEIGHYSGIIDLGDKALGISTDGVGSKLLLAIKAGRYDTVGIDLVGMLANDLIVNGLEPLTMVDYIACEKPLEEDIMKSLALGLVEGARQAGISIVGGETAILPDIIRDFDLAGTVVGTVDKGKIITGREIRAGDVIIGLESSGLHSNGYSLARKVLDTNDQKTLDALLVPTRIYVKPVLEMIQKCKVHGLAHITGGAYTKLRRLGDFGFDIRLPKFSGLFAELSKSVPEKEMYTVFNCGIGFAVILERSEADKTVKIARKHGISAFEIGSVNDSGKIKVNGVVL